ncbi:MAG TPA: CAAX prenyl protease-related protein [Pirellulales bacterium]
MLTPYRTNPWLVCLLPFVVFMLVGSLEPVPPEAAPNMEQAAAKDSAKESDKDPEKPQPAATEPVAEKSWFSLRIEYRHYPLIYTAKIVLTALAMFFIWPGYRQYTGRIGWLAVVVGGIGAAVWIALATLQHQWMPMLAEKTGIEWFKSLGQRSAFNPADQMHGQFLLAHAFLLVRFVGLTLIVPIIEEFFLRGFVMRFVMAERWWESPFGVVNRTAVIVGTALPMLAHPQELVAALVWFSAVTWLMVRTRSIWSCVMAHGITNLLLGIYVVASGAWWLM